MAQQVAIIPARGGSKRLPRKNVLPVLGRPMLSYPVRAALESGLFDQVIVSTEDPEIAEAAAQAGARVMDRPDELATDASTVVQVCGQVLKALREEGVSPWAFCCIYATAVFVTPGDLAGSLALLDQDPPADVVMGVSEYDKPPVQALREEGGYLARMWPEYIGVKSQFHPRLVVSSGTLYWVRSEPFSSRPSFYPERLKGYGLPRNRAVDVDTPEDYELMQLLAEKYLKK